ncbi:MAG: metalloregulator ArsR/SmtB family transcription factor [Candidatus Lernaella stagnicola]|nr:metalloregulator ArsR/SmtB family transcription factor [Candidatus Lernaella stagnicola]
MSDTKDFADTLKLMGNPTRLRILAALADGSCHVGRICRLLNLPQATVSQHLALLRNSDIVSARRDGVKVCYSLDDALTEQILNLIHKTKGKPGGTHARS